MQMMQGLKKQRTFLRSDTISQTIHGRSDTEERVNMLTGWSVISLLCRVGEAVAGHVAKAR